MAGCSEAALLLADIEAGPAPSALKDATPSPTLAPWPVPGTEADLWRPGPGAAARARLVLVPGLSEAGRRDARLVSLAQTLARAGFVVLVPDLPAARRLAVSASDAEAIASAILALPNHPGPAGLAAISYAAGPAVLAALRPEVGGRLQFVATLGAYHDPESFLTFLITGAHRDGEVWRFGRPRPEALWLFLLANAGNLPDAREAFWLRAAADARLRGLPLPGPPPGPGAAAVLALAEERDPQAIPARLAALPAPIRAELASLSLAGAPLERFAVCTILIHGEADPVIPWTESRRLAWRLPRVRLHLIPGLDHVEPAGLPLPGQLALLRAAEDLLAARDGRDPCADASPSRPREGLVDLSSREPKLTKAGSGPRSGHRA